MFRILKIPNKNCPSLFSDVTTKIVCNYESFDSDEDNSNDPQSSDSETTFEYQATFLGKSSTPLPSLSSYDLPRETVDAATLKVKRLRANDRERRRVNLINSAMEMLRKVIPELRERRKITKLELLRSANKYIWILQQSLLTGRSIPEIQQALSFYQYNGPISSQSYFSCEYVHSYSGQSSPPQ